MKIDVVIGLSYGDEGKGKIVDVLAERADLLIGEATALEVGRVELDADGEVRADLFAHGPQHAQHEAAALLGGAAPFVAEIGRAHV